MFSTTETFLLYNDVTPYLKPVISTVGVQYLINLSMGKRHMQNNTWEKNDTTHRLSCKSGEYAVER